MIYRTEVDLLDSFKLPFPPALRIETECSQNVMSEGKPEGNGENFEQQDDLMQGKFGALRLDCLAPHSGSAT